MSGELLDTKLHIPPVRANLVARPRLVERLNRALANRHILLSAPAGFGKTALLSQWLAASPSPAAWLSLDAGDNDPALFLDYVIAALRRTAPEIGERAGALLHSPQPPPLDSILKALVNDLNRSISPLTLVLDDYHVIDASPVHSGMSFLFESLPPHVHVAIATRVDPPLPLPRLRARGLLTELRTDDLRFTSAEVSTLFKSAALGLSAEDAARLGVRTEGWIVGLQMAALSLQGRPRDQVSQLVREFSGSHHFVLDYLVDQVLDRQPQNRQSFLLHTSILDRLSGPLCDAVTEQNQGQETLEALERENLFLVPLDDERHWYRYHHLFADLLRARLSQSQPNEMRALHVRASAWYADRGLAAEAIGHACDGGNFERAARLIEENAMATMSRGQLATLIAWIQRLPAPVARRPSLQIQKAWAFTFAGELDQAQVILEGIEQQIPSKGSPEAQALQGQITLMRALMADITGDVPRAIALAHEADRLLPDRSLPTISLIPFILGKAYRTQGDLANAETVLSEILRFGKAQDNLWTLSVGMSELAMLRQLQGRRRDAQDLYRDILQLAAERGPSAFSTVAGANIRLGDLLVEENRLEEARHYVQQALDDIQAWGQPNDLVFANTVLGHILQAQGELESASLALHRAEEVARRFNVYPYYRTLMETTRVKLWLAQGRIREAANWANKVAENKGSPLMREMEQTTVARVLIAQGRTDEALMLLTRLADAAEAGGRMGRLVEMQVLQAKALHAVGRTDQALAILGSSLSFAETEGYVRLYLDEGAPMADLLLRFNRRLGPKEATSPTQAYVLRLLDCFGQQTTSALSPLSAQPVPEPLTDREREVLRLMANGLSNQEIADKLVISVRTVKKHVENVRGKLNVPSRARAIVRARELDLL